MSIYAQCLNWLCIIYAYLVFFLSCHSAANSLYMKCTVKILERWFLQGHRTGTMETPSVSLKKEGNADFKYF